MGRSILVACAVGVVLSFVAVAAGTLATGTAWQSAVGLGLFVAFWGGLGFGTMIGGVVYASGLESATSWSAGSGAPSVAPEAEAVPPTGPPPVVAAPESVREPRAV